MLICLWSASGEFTGPISALATVPRLAWNRVMTTRIRLTFHTLLLLLVLSLTFGSGPTLAAGSSRDQGSDSASRTARIGEVPMLAHADAYGPGIWHHAREGKTWYGAYRTFKGANAYCIDAGKQSPLPEYFKGSTPKKITSPRTAWALHQHSASKSKNVHAALSAMARLDTAIPHDHTVPPQEPKELGKKFKGSAKQFAAITADAARFAGPYRLKVGLQTTPGMPVLEPHAKSDGERKPTLPDSDQVELSVSLVSASGHLVPDIPIHLKVEGLEDTPATLTTSSKAEVETYTVTGPGKVSVTGTAQVAPETVLLFEPTKARVQRVITADKPTEVSARAAIDVTSAPTVTTEISDQTPTPGESVTDEFTVSGLVGDHTVTVVHELWRTASKPEPGKKNDDAEVIGTVTSKSVGNGTHRSAAIEIPDDFRGWLYFTETIAADAKTREWKGIHGQPRETGFVPWTPTADTTAVLTGTQAHDEVDIRGMRPGSAVSATVTAYHSAEQPKQSSKVGGEKIDSQDFRITADQDGKASLRTSAITAPVGWVTFVVTVNGDDAHKSWTSDWGIPAETVHRAAPEPEPPTPVEEPPTPVEEPPAPTDEPSAPATQPPPPGDTPPPADESPAGEPPAPDGQPPAPTAEPPPPAPEPSAAEPPAAEPPVEPVADQPQAPRAPDQLPRTGAPGNAALVGAGLLLIGLGVTALLVSGRRDSTD